MQREEAYAAQHTYDKCFWVDVQAGDGSPLIKLMSPDTELH